MTETKKCPMCAEQIPADSIFCPYCRTQFTEDAHVSPPASIVEPENLPPVHPTPRVVRKKPTGSLSARIIGLILIFCGISLLLWTQRAKIPAFSGLLASPTRTIIPTLTPTHTPTIIPTRTTRPTATATPAPVLITFDTIGSYPEGQLVILSGLLEMFKSTYCGTECGLLLTQYSGSGNTITIFVRVAQPGVDPSPNQMKALPDPYSKWDIVVCLDDGSLAYIGNRITVTGRICKTTSDEPCISNIVKIEKENR